jgi:hypothetical protein
METMPDWREVYDFWFPPGLDEADAATHHGMFQWWFDGGANAELPRFRPLVDAAMAGRCTIAPCPRAEGDTCGPPARAPLVKEPRRLGPLLPSSGSTGGPRPVKLERPG